MVVMKFLDSYAKILRALADPMARGLIFAMARGLIFGGSLPFGGDEKRPRFSAGALGFGLKVAGKCFF